MIVYAAYAERATARAISCRVDRFGYGKRSVPSDVFTPLERGQLHVMRLRAFGVACLLGIAALALAVALRERFPAFPTAAILAPVALLLIYFVILAPQRRFRAWGYRLAGEELQVVHGVWTQVETHVPLARVQHVDVSQGPLERTLAVCRLVLHTAGTANSVVVIPGLARATAEAIRDEVRVRIGQSEE